jgi:murein DD-endopeptidase MepM/ murein hydrolase activator NlpD
MFIPHETKTDQNVGSGRKKFFSLKWMVPLMCLLIIFFMAIFANYHQKLSAGSIGTTQLGPVRHSGGVQKPDLEKMARSNDNKLATRPSIWPVSGESTSGFGWRDSPWGGGSEFHPGMDIANSMDTPVVATADGVVVQSGWSEGYGNVVQIDHGNGIATIYGHNSSIIVSVGKNVRKGQVISYMGSTGRSTGPHLHYEIRVNGIAVDPISFLAL